MQEDWIMALIGGGFIGAAATILLLANGRVAGVSGILFGLMHPLKGDTLWRAKFVVGLMLGGVISLLFQPEHFINTTDRSLLVTAIAGLLVGFGTRLGGGCTSGHGVCGISRMSPRSLIATGSFIVAGALTVLIARMALG